MTYSETIEYLYGLRWFGTKFGLENTLKLAGLAGNPQQRLRFIHVAGTNGKGSTCAMLEAIYRAAGLKVGLFTSPHLVAFGERIQVNRRPISEQEIVAQVDWLRGLLARFPREEHPTFFEVVTVMALRYFSEQRCDLVIWETGLGGRLDATNIVTPLASVITNIEYDHQKWLGYSIEEIAAEKSGIIKEGIPVITGAERPEALAVIRKTAAEKDAPLSVVNRSEAEKATAGIPLSLRGEHQKLNAALALSTVEALAAKIAAPIATARRALADVRWEGRLQLLARASGQRILLDGAHNEAGARALADALRRDFSGELPALVLGILADKDIDPICRLLAPLGNRIFLTRVQSERSAGTRELAAACRAANPKAKVTEHACLADALKAASDLPFVVLTGSLYLIGEALELLRGEPAGRERLLNEWGQSSRPGSD
ncbi:MAG TPA: folylpolyglutamate synthase/dihydrofolate synthase family protein [Verrucomicrobiae bacterium]|nr:folylpolyglutamate synthase/dihydrofolate synthase family protein [Verrucomicrobiae bacterium]